MMRDFNGLTVLAGDVQVAAVPARISQCETGRGGEG